MTWVRIVEEESAYLEAIGKKLVELDTARDGNPAMESIYASFWQAYNVGVAQLQKFEQDLTNVQKAINTGQLDSDQFMFMKTSNITQDRWAGGLEVLGCLICMFRPSDAFKLELRKQQQAIIDALYGMLTNQQEKTESVISDLSFLAELICTFEERVSSETSWLQALLHPASLAAIAVAGAGAYIVGTRYGGDITPFLTREEIGEVAPMLPAPEEVIEG